MQSNNYLLAELSRVINKASFRLKAFIILLTGFGFLFSPLIAHADYSAPSWWNGDQCDSTHYTAGNGHTPVLQSTWSGIQSCGYGPNQSPYNWSDVSVTLPGASAADYEWECTELVKRYLYIAYGATALSSTNGDQVVANYASSYKSLFKSTSNTADSSHGFPNVGDVISYSDVHTAIITGVTVTDQANGNATLSLVEQNASLSGTTTQKVIGWKIKGDIDDPNDTGSDTVTAWLTPLAWSNNSPSGTTHDSIYAMAASSTSSVWAAGYEAPSGSNNQPISYFNNGSGWTKYSPPSQGTYNTHKLFGIASSSSGDTWTVGEVDFTNPQTLAYHWNSSTLSWTHVTSDNASSTHQNTLTSVGIDGSGNVFAVGYYNDGTNLQPLLEKWNGTKFAQQTLSLPSGAIAGQLYSVAFSSSTNGWAVGYVAEGTGPYTYPYVVYQYNGSSWTSTTGFPSSSTNASLVGVTAVSDNEAWAVGKKKVSSVWVPLIMHYTSANGWQEDTSFTFPSSTTLYSVSADSSSDVWIVGASGTSPYTMHYNGSSWAQVTTPSVSGTSYLQGVAVNSGVAWTGGQSGSNPNPLTFKSL